MNFLKQRASLFVLCLISLLVSSVNGAINSTYSLWNASSNTQTIDSIAMDSTQTVLFITERAKVRKAGATDLVLSVVDTASLRTFQRIVFPGCTTVQSPVQSYLATFPYFQSYDGVVQKSENAVVLCRNDTGQFMFEIVHTVSTWPSTWTIGRTFLAKDPKKGAGAGLYTHFSSFQPPLSPNIAGRRMPIIGTSGKIYFLGKWQSTNLLMAINLDTFSLEEIGMFGEGVNVLDLLAQANDTAAKSAKVDWYVSIADANATVSLAKISLANLPSLELIALPPLLPAPFGFAGSFHLPLATPAIAETPALLRRNSTGLLLTSQGNQLNPRPSMFKFDSNTGALGAALTISKTTYVAASAGISGRNPCGYLFGADLLQYHINNTLTQFEFTNDLHTAPRVIDSVSTPALGNWPSTYNFMMLTADDIVMMAFGSQVATFAVSCPAASVVG